MEDLSDPFENFQRTDGQTVSDEDPTVGTNVVSQETNIEYLISELTGGISQQNASAVSDNNKTNTGGGVVLTDPTNIDDILAIDEALIPPTSHNVSVLGVACQQVLKQMEYQLLTLLRKNRKEQEIIQSYLDSNFKNSCFDTTKKPSLKCTGMPYFKDHHGFQPPPNEDVLKKQRNNKLLPADFIKSYPIWNSADSKKLIQAVKQFDIGKPSAIDWLKISVIDMQGKYSASECKAKWMMHLTPGINRSKWTMKEMESLKELSAKYNYQDWDKVAEELGTNRTGLQCCVRFHTHTPPTVGKWTKEEDKILKKLVEKYKVKDCIPWKKVVWHFENRSLRQCQERYAYHLGNIKRGNFSMGEDFVIVYLASKLKNFGEVAKFLPNRVSTQVRARYEYLVEISMPQFSKEEDELLSKLMVKYPRNWGKISEHFKNRSRVQCRKRWAYLQKKIHIDVDKDVEDDEFGDSLLENGRPSNERSQVDAENVKKHIPFMLKHANENRRYPEIYKKLMDYHKICHKFLYGPKPRIPANEEDLKTLTSKMAVTMKTLSVTPAGPLKDFNMESLSNNCEFNKEDLAVLNGLTSNEERARGFELSTRITPPNYMTLVALRTFTLGWNFIQNLCCSHTDTPRVVQNEIDPEDRLLCSDAKKLFKTRMKSIFAFPLILSNISAAQIQKPVQKSKVKKGKPLSKRKRKEHARLMSAAYRNKLKTICEKFEESSDIAALPEQIEGLESSKNRRKKSKSARKIAKKSENSEGEGDLSESKRRCVNVSTSRMGGNSEGNVDAGGNQENTKKSENSEMSGCRKRTRSVKTEFVTPLKKRAVRNTIKETVTNSKT